MVGDSFLDNSYHTLQKMKSEAVLHSEPPPYLYQIYNLSAWYTSALSDLKPLIVRFLNSMIEAMNRKKHPHLPKYILMMPDKDLLQNTKIPKTGIKAFLRIIMQWWVTQTFRALNNRRENLKSKHTGAVSADPTQVIWIKMFPRPISVNEDLIKVLKIRRKFNGTSAGFVQQKAQAFNHVIEKLFKE